MIFGNTAEGSQLTPLYTVTLPERATSHIPFTGRRKEEAGIEQFCKTVFSHDTTSVMWISGQAGIGKSYLLRSVSRKIEKSGTIVLHIQFYPFGSSSVLGLLRHLLSVRTDLHSLITEPIQETTSSTISAMRRLIRLRPTLLILEDVHLLQDEGAAELSSLIAAISHEPVAIICAARPIESASYTALLPWITSSMKLSPFSVEEVGELLVGCGIGQAQTIAPHLHRATRGIPLVLRSILLELLQRLREGKLDVTSDNLWEARINERTKAILHSIAPGIASGISPTEQMAFERLSLLGEVFSREAARRLVPEADEIVERGIAAGILAFKRTFHPSLWGQGSTDYPICFVHTLLHESFLARSSGLSISDTLELLESETPLYSTLPIYHIVPQESDTPAESLLPLIRNMCERSRRLLHTTDWILARSILDPVETLYKSMKQAISSEDELLARLTILQGKLFSLRVKFFSDEMRDILQQYLHATEAPATEEIALHRATALSWQARLSFSKPHQSENEGWSPSVIFTETFMLSEKFPRLLGTSHFVALLSTIASSPEKSEEQRQQLRSVLYRVLDETTDLDARLMIYFRLVPYLLLDPTSEEFVEEGINLMEEGEIDIDDDADGLRYVIALPRLIAIGKTDYASRLIEQYVVRPLQGRSLETEITFRGMEGMLAASIGLPLDHVEQIFRKLTDELSEHMHGIGHESTVLYEMIANWLCTIGNIRGNPDWGENLSRILCGKEMPEYQILEAGILSDNQEKIERGIELRYAPEVLRSLATHSLGNNQTLSDELVSRLSSFLQASSSGQIAMLHLNAAALLLEKIGEPIPDEIRTALVQALERGLQWCKEKGLVGVAEQLLERSRVCWSPSTIKGWKEQFRQRRADALQLWGIHKQSSVSTKLSFVTMMDEISICYADLPPQPIPGTRVQQTLGLLVANQQMKHSLTLETFRELATGIEADPSGSANYLRVIVSRIRTILGKDSIISDGKNPPYLNTCVVQVDLLEASEELDRCVEAIRTLRPRRAKQEVLKALQRSGGKALYPTLEGEFFDAARQDFEIRIRKAVLSTAHLLSQEKDSEEAADLLRTATLLMPEDEEVAEELISLLRSLERHAEAFSMSRQLLR